ncbi:MAG: helix-turn-helix domain-containing protein [Clostridiaceae bacterium]|nr:helix-turn-helix domain-containing protein [Clostridiaceae bacterium]
MRDIQLAEASELSLDRSKHAVQTYSRSVGAECMVIDTHGNIVAHAFPKGRCGLCKILGGRGERCGKAHLYGSYQAERFGGRYIFFCPIGLVHWVSPIICGGVSKGAVLGGPVLMTEPDELLIEEITISGGFDKKDISEIKRLVRQLPIVSPEAVKDYSEMLYMVSLYISGGSDGPSRTRMQALEQQSRISEYVQYIKSLAEGCGDTRTYPVEKEKELLSLIPLGDKAGSQKVLNEILGHVFFTSGGNFDVMKARILELIVLLSRAALEGGADIEQIFGLNCNYLSQINCFNTIDELTYWLSGIMIRFTDCVFDLKDVKHIDVIYKAVDYIRRNYMKKILLKDVASHVQLSTSYFCAIFKKEMKCNFNSYLNKVRIEMSKKLLTDHDIPLVDVANMVGYEDQSYFTRVFRSNVGISPGKYRERNGQMSF